MTMQMRLIHRIISGRHLLPDPSVASVIMDMNALAEKCNFLGKTYSTWPHVVFDNVAEFYAHHPQDLWGVGDIPNWAPPWKMFFAEWNEPEEWLMDGDIVKKPGGSQVGFGIISLPVKEELKNNDASWIKLLASLAGTADGSFGGEATNETVCSLMKRSRWILACESWCTTSEKPLCGLAFWNGVISYVFVDENGHGLGHLITGPCSQHLASINRESLTSPIIVLGLGISFCHCKNVAVCETHDGKPSQKHHGARKSAGVKSYVLDIGPMTRVLKSEGQSESSGLVRALHICRGHFATYSEDRPLFGKHSGTFWIPDHVRGNADAGKVEKSYKVTP